MTGPRVRSHTALDVLFAEWLVAYRADHDDRTAETYELYARAHFLPAFPSLSRIHSATIAEYARARLGKVLRKTVYKELGALRVFLRWCVERGLLDAVPEFPELAARATGVRAGPQRETPPELEAHQVEAALAALPERSVHGWPVRARFVVAYETGLRPSTLDALSVPEHWRPERPGELRLATAIDKVRYGRVVPLTARAVEALRSTGVKLGLVFGRHDYRAHLERAGAAAGLPGALCSYDLRHARGTHWADAGGNLPGIAHLLGHRLVSTTSKYVHPSRRAAVAVLQTEQEKKHEQGSHEKRTDLGQPNADDAARRVGSVGALFGEGGEEAARRDRSDDGAGARKGSGDDRSQAHASRPRGTQNVGRGDDVRGGGGVDGKLELDAAIGCVRGAVGVRREGDQEALRYGTSYRGLEFYGGGDLGSEASDGWPAGSNAGAHTNWRDGQHDAQAKAAPHQTLRVVTSRVDPGVTGQPRSLPEVDSSSSHPVRTGNHWPRRRSEDRDCGIVSGADRDREALLMLGAKEGSRTLTGVTPLEPESFADRKSDAVREGLVAQKATETAIASRLSETRSRFVGRVDSIARLHSAPCWPALEAAS